MNPNDLFPELKSIKPPVDVSDPTPWMLIFFAVVVTVGSVAMLSVIATRKKSSKKVLTPREEALALLDKIRLDDLHRAPEASAFYVALSDVLRLFLQKQFGIPAAEMTTEEFLSSLKEHERLTADQKAMIERFIRHCDLVKFARQMPDADEARKHFEQIRNFVKEI